jgi:hypothetical protein
MSSDQASESLLGSPLEETLKPNRLISLARPRVPIAAALALTVVGWSLMWLIALLSTWPVWPAVVVFAAGLASIPFQPAPESPRRRDPR